VLNANNVQLSWKVTISNKEKEEKKELVGFVLRMQPDILKNKALM